MEQRLASVLGGGHRRSRTGKPFSTRRNPTMQPPLERGLHRGPMDGLDLDQFEQAFPIAVNAARSTTLGAVQQRTKRPKFRLEGAQRRLALHDPPPRRLERG